ncbi:amidase [Paenirhodobacter populi]|uniref:Amidase n=1 Tax=Paenirhodobacter populi TaxID=2306993 RepID=A0A443IMK1_9RHOB|nr:amidase [Sinirhodobacter populi]RWR06565.1 amidase [Sinirhodobacter populi]
MILRIATIADALARGEMTSEALVRQCLSRIHDPKGEGARAFTRTLDEQALAEARASDARRVAGRTMSPIDGIPVSIKCLFDVAGMVTHSGSRVLANTVPATQDAAAVARLRAAGAVVLGHTNMTEFAYSGLGMNPHYGTPGNPANRSRVPGGSSSGAAVSVGDGMAVIGLGTDTGGSCRIPAAFCGLTGFKPTARRVPMAGTYPLSETLDSIGSIAADVAGVALVDAVISGEDATLVPVPLKGLRFGLLQNYVTADVEPAVQKAFDAAVARLHAAGVEIVPLTLPAIEQIPAMNAQGGITAAEALALHRDLLAVREAEYDPRVSVRIRKAEAMVPGAYEALLAQRLRMIAQCDAATLGLDAVLMPTTPIVAPATAALDADEALYGKVNLLALRNPTVANFLDRCALSLPVAAEALPVGLMLMGETGTDRRLLAIGAAVEAALGHVTKENA